MNNSNIDDVKSRIKKHLESPYSFQNIHGSNVCCLENITFSVGINQEEIHDKEITEFYELCLLRFTRAEGIVNSDFIRSMVMNCLLYMGNKLGRRDSILTDEFRERLNRLYDFSISGKQIFYTDEERKDIKSVPEVWQNQGIVRYEHTSPFLRLPLIYDLLGFSTMYGTEPETDMKINTVISYIFSERYQEEVKDGYGIGISKKNEFVKGKFYAVGWDMGLTRITIKQEMLYMLLLANISTARDSKWYKQNLLKYKNAIETNDIEFLTEICKPIRKTYWTGGCYINFGHKKTERLNSLIEMINRLPL